MNVTFYGFWLVNIAINSYACKLILPYAKISQYTLNANNSTIWNIKYYYKLSNIFF